MADILESPQLQPPATSLSSFNNASGKSSPPGISHQSSHTRETHKKSIAIISTLLALDAAIMPLALLYPMWHASGLAPAYIFAVIKGVFGIISGLEWAYRSRQLWKKEDVRPFGARGMG